MAIDRTLHAKRDPDAASMDRIRVPDTANMKKIEDKPYRSTGTTSAADQIFSNGGYTRQERFGAANSSYKGSSNTVKKDRRYYEEKEYDDDFIPKRDPNKKAPGHLYKGVKVGTSYVMRLKIIIWIVVALLLLGLSLLFLPPLMNSTTEETQVDFERNIFKDMGKTEYMTFALANYSVYNEDAFSSERSSNYRVIEMTVHVQNSSPFEVTIPQYKAAYVPRKYKDKVCYVTSTVRQAKKEGSGKVVGDTIDGFSGKEVKIEMMINVTDMTEEELDECVTGMVLTTVDAKKRVARNVYLPCIPAVLFVSDTVTVPLNP